jgi:hypothetical protein
MNHRISPQRLCALSLAMAATGATASCGSAYCTLMTDRFAQGSGEPHVGWSADMRLESVRQTRLRTGTRFIDASQVTGEEAIERSTRNLNLVATLEYGLDEHWSLSLRLPFVRRDHSHDLVDATTGAPTTPERWRFSRLGDLQVLARRQALVDDGATSVAVFGGLKLPTGSIRVTNDEGVRAERALQPGTGTTDLIFGIAGRRALGAVDAVVGQVAVAQALSRREDFKPGTRVDVALGWSHAFSRSLGTVLQLNWRHRASDMGAQAEPGNSGSTTLDISPGITFGVGAASTIYAYVQRPLYQKVTGIQLVPRNSLAVGWTGDF